MDQATIWVLMVVLAVHVLFACVAMFYLYKDSSISIKTKVVHGLLAWLVPVVGWVFSFSSIFSGGLGKRYPSRGDYDNYSDFGD